MKLSDWLARAKREIDSLDADLIAMQNFAPARADRSWLVAHGEDKIDERRRKSADKMLMKRQNGVPLAYIVGEKEFYGRKFAVQPGVLIPRPETETLIDLIKGLKLPIQPHFLEVGTGSGCIAITLALEYPQSYVMASDLSTKALTVAEYNDLRHEGRVELVESNLLRDLDFEGNPEHFDVVVANLPYVNKDWDWLDTKNLGFEPAMALYARGNNGLSTYQRFLKEIYHYDGPDGLWMDYLVLEADPCQQAQLIKMAEKAGFIHLKTEGFGLLFESNWRYWWDYRTNEYVHKPESVIKAEREIGSTSFMEEELRGLEY